MSPTETIVKSVKKNPFGAIMVGVISILTSAVAVSFFIFDLGRAVQANEYTTTSNTERIRKIETVPRVAESNQIEIRHVREMLERKEKRLDKLEKKLDSLGEKLDKVLLELKGS